MSEMMLQRPAAVAKPKRKHAAAAAAAAPVVAAPAVALEREGEQEERKEEPLLEAPVVDEPAVVDAPSVVVAAPLERLDAPVAPPDAALAPAIEASPLSVLAEPTPLFAPVHLDASLSYPSLQQSRQSSADPGEEGAAAIALQHSPVYPHAMDPGAEQEEDPGGMAMDEQAQASPGGVNEAHLQHFAPHPAMAPPPDFPAYQPQQQQQQQHEMQPQPFYAPPEQAQHAYAPQYAPQQQQQLQYPPQQQWQPQQQMQQQYQPVQLQPQLQHQPAPFQVLQAQAALQAAAQLQLSVPNLLAAQMQARARVLQRPAIASVVGRLESDAQSAALFAAQQASARAYGSWFERRAGSLRGRFFDLVESWRSAHFQVCSVVQAALDGQVSCAAALQRVWSLRTVQLQQKHVCGDAVTLEHSITHAVADYSVREAEKAHDALVALQRLAVQELASHRFLANTALLQVELYLAELLAPQGLAPGVAQGASSASARGPQRGEGDGEGMVSAPGGAPVHSFEGGGYAPSASSSSSYGAAAAFNPSAVTGSSSSSSAATPAPPASADFLSQLRSCVDVLFYFEKLRDEKHEQARTLWRMRARQRAEQRRTLGAQRASMDAILHSQQMDAPAAGSPPPAPVVFGAAAGQNSPAQGSPPAVDLTEDEGEFDEIGLDSPAASSPGPAQGPGSPVAAAAREDTQFRSGVRRWLRIAVEALMSRGEHADFQYVLAQVVRCRGCTRWASFVQFARANAREAMAARENAHMRAVGAAHAGGPAAPADEEGDPDGWEWSPAFRAHFLSCLTMILEPLDGRQLRMAPASGALASGAAASGPLDDFVAGNVPRRERLAAGEGERAAWQREAEAAEGESVRVGGGPGGAEDASSPGEDDDDDGMGVPRSSAGASSSAAAASSAGAEWLLLDQSKLQQAANADVCFRVACNESDYADLLSHAPLLPFVRSRVYGLFLRVARRHVGLHAAQGEAEAEAGAGAGAGGQSASDPRSAGGYDSAYEAFDRQALTASLSEVKLVLHLLSAALQGPRSFPPEYSNLKKTLAKLQTQVVGLVGAAWTRAWSRARREQRQGAGSGFAPGGVQEMREDDDDDESEDDEAEQQARARGGVGAPGAAPHTGLWPYPCCISCHGFYALLQKELDFAVLRLVASLAHTDRDAPGLKHFLSELPLHLPSVEAAGQVLLALFSQARAADYADSSLSFQPLLLGPWQAFLATPAGQAARQNFASLLLGDGSFIYVLQALTKLATLQPFEISPAVLPPLGEQPPLSNAAGAQGSHAITLGGPDFTPGQDGFDEEKRDAGAPRGSRYPFRSPCTDLPLILLHELFHAAYINLATREESFRSCQPFLVSLCATHPLGISFLLHLTHAHWRFIGPGALALFDSLELRAWRPTASCVYTLQSLLLTPPSSASNELARAILLRLNYDFVITERAVGGASKHNSRRPSRSLLGEGRRARSRRGSAAQQNEAAAAAAAGAHLFFPPRSRTPVLGWALHRALLLMLADVRLASLRSAVLASSLASPASPQGVVAAAPLQPPPVPFTSCVEFPSCAWASLTTSGAGATASRRGSLMSPPAQGSLPAPPPVEAHLQQQWAAQQRQLAQQGSPPGLDTSQPQAPAFSSAAPAPAAATFSFAHGAEQLGALLAPATSLLGDVFSVSGSGRRSIDPAWWVRVLSLLCVRDASCVAPPLRSSKSWLSARWALANPVDLEEYTAIVRRDPVLGYVQLQVSYIGSDAPLFGREGWPLLKALLAEPTWAPLGWRALHDLLPNLVRSPLSSAPPSPAVGPSPSWVALSGGAGPPVLSLGASSSSLVPPRIPARPSVSASSSSLAVPAGNNNPFGAGGPVLAPASVGPVSGLPSMQSLGLLRHVLESSRPKGMFAWAASKSATFDAVHTLSLVASAHLITCLRAPVSPATPGDSPLHALLSYWSMELVCAPAKLGEPWAREHNLRFVYDALCRAVLLCTDWFGAGAGAASSAGGGNDERARADVLQSAQALRMLLQFTGEQAVAAVVAGAGGASNADKLLGAERRSGAYLDVGGQAALNPYAAASAASAARGAPAPHDDELELQFPFDPHQKVPKHLLDSLCPPESLLTSFVLNPREALARHAWASFTVLLEDTLADRAGWLRLGHIVSRWDEKAVLKVALKKAGVGEDRVRRACMVRRWFTHALQCPPEHPLLPLMWQMAFRLLFSRLHLSNPPPKNLGGFFGFRFLTGTSGRQLVQSCREALGTLVIQAAKRRAESISAAKPGALLHPSVHELPSLFAAMQSWLTEESSVSSASGAHDAQGGPLGHLNSLRERLLGFGVSLQDKFMPARLASILLPPAQRNVALWWDLVDLGRLRHELVAEIVSHPPLRGQELLATPRAFAMQLPGSPDLASHAFFHRYYTTQAYALGRYAPTPREVVALLKRRSEPLTAKDSNPFAGDRDAPLSDAELRAVVSAAEYARPELAKLAPVNVGAGDALAQRMLLSVSAGGPGNNKRRRHSLGYWSGSVSPPPPATVLAGALSGVGDSGPTGLRVPSVLLASLWDLLGEESHALQPLAHATRMFSERYSRAMALDRQALEFLPGLFRNEAAQYTIVKPCRVGFMGASQCRLPAHFVFSFTRALRIARVAEALAENRAAAAQTVSVDVRANGAIGEEVSPSLCATLIAVQRLLHHIVLVAAQPVSGEAPSAAMDSAEGALVLPPGGAPGGAGGGGGDHWQRSVVSAGLRWLWALADLDTEVTKLFPPAFHFVSSSVAQLCPLLYHPYAQGVALQERLLELLARHTRLQATLSGALRPEVAADPNAYLGLLRLALTVRDEHGVASVRVLRRFDIAAWLAQAPQPPFAVRSQLLQLCMQCLREEEKQPRRRQVGSPAGSASEALCNTFAEMACALVRASVPDTFAPFLRVVLEETSNFGCSGSPYAPPASAAASSSAPASAAQASGLAHAPAWLQLLWRTLRELPLQTLPFEQLSKCCALIEGCLWDIRRAHSQHVAGLLQQKQLSPAQQASLLTHSNQRLLSLLGDLLPPLVSFFTSLFDATHPAAFPPAAHDSAESAVVCYASSDTKKRAAWQAVWQAYSAFLAPDPPPLAGGIGATMPSPWLAHAALDRQLEVVLGGLVAAMGALGSASRAEDPWLVQAFWHTYREQITVQAEAPFLAALHHAIIAHTKVSGVVEPLPAGGSPPFRPLSQPPQLDWHASWVLGSADLHSFTHTLRQVVELHERELATLMATETARREAEHAQQALLARGNARREAKLVAPSSVTRQDVRLMSQQGSKVSVVATFLSHLLSTADCLQGLQQVRRPRGAPRRGLGGIAPEVAPRDGPGLLEPAALSNPYELYAASPSADYASTLLLTLVGIVIELPCAPFNSHSSAAAAAMALSQASSLVLPHFQALLDTLLRLDWSAVLLVRLPPEAFMMRLPGDADQTPLPGPEESHALGLQALEREVAGAQSLLEQVSQLLYSDRAVARVTEEAAFLAMIAPAPAPAASSSSSSKQGLLATLLTNPFAAFGAASSGALSPLSPTASVDGSPSPQPRSPNAGGLPLTDADVYGLMRPHFSRQTGQLQLRFALEPEFLLPGSRADIAAPMARVYYVFRILSRLCAPQPPSLFLANQSWSSARHFFVPLVVALRRARLYAEWLLSVFHGEGSRPLMHEAQYLSVAASLLSELDAGHDAVQGVVGDEELVPLLQEFLFMANLESRGVAVSPAVRALTERIFSSSEWPRLTLLAFAASCRSIVSLEKLATFLETALHAWMLTHGIWGTVQGAPALVSQGAPRVSHWQTVAATLQVPELSFDNFIASCLRNGSILTLHVVALQQLMQGSCMLLRAGGGHPAEAPGAGPAAGAPHTPSAGSSYADAAPSTPSSSSLLDPLSRHLMAQPRTSFAPAGAGASSAAPIVGLSPLLDAKALQSRVEQLAQWLQKVSVKDVPSAEKGRGASASASGGAGGAASPASSIPLRPSSRHAQVSEEDAEPVKLLVALRTLLEWQGALVRAWMQARHAAVWELPAVAARWSNPLLASLRVYPDPFPLPSSASGLLDGVQALLARWGAETRASSGVMGLIGLSSSHRFSPRFRLLLRALHTYLLLHCAASSAQAAQGLAEGKLKASKAPPLHFCWEGPGGAGDAGMGPGVSGALPPATRQALLSSFLALASSKSFAPHAGVIRVLGAMLSQAADRATYAPANPHASTFVPLIYAPLVLDQLVACIFPELGS